MSRRDRTAWLVMPAVPAVLAVLAVLAINSPRGVAQPGATPSGAPSALPAAASSTVKDRPGRFPFVIPGFDASPSATDFSHLNHKPAGRHGFVRVKDGHFATDAGRLRIWGVNLCFGACFPKHEDARRVAAHLAKLGVNSVRFHHFETQDSPNGILRRDGSFDPEQVDKLDYFLAKLHEHGIYANINPHVGNTPSKRLGIPSIGKQHYTQNDKFVLHFQPEIQREVFRFYRTFFSHVNPYRKLKRSEDPGIALVEITNENRFALAGPELLFNAPEPYRSEIRRQWNAWLKKRYKTSRGLRDAWKPDAAVDTGTLADSSKWGDNGQGGWTLADHGGKAPITMSTGAAADKPGEGDNGSPSLRFVSKVVSKQRWHQQLASPRIAMKQGHNYTLSFMAKADEPRSFSLNIAHFPGGEWASLGLARDPKVGTTWQRFKFYFKATGTTDDDGRVAFDLGGSDVPIALKDVVLRGGGGTVVLPEGQTVEAANVDLPDSDWVTPAQASLRAFMRDTESAFYAKAKALLRDELGVRVPISTTQANYQPLDILAKQSDFADMHAYWHHPIFAPGQQWSAEGWTVQSEPLVSYPFHNKWPRVNLLMRTSWRVHGMPFTFSEWNAGEPGFFSAGAVPVAAMLAALQDWDAVYFFNYHDGRGDWDTDRMAGYFSINGQPVKKGLLAACANLCRRGDLSALKQQASASEGGNDRFATLALRHRLGVLPVNGSATVRPITQKLPAEEAIKRRDPALLTTPSGSVRWEARDREQAHVVINTPATRIVWGLVGGKTIDLGNWRLRFGECERRYAVFVATSRDGKPLEQSKSVLITVVGNAENQAMGWNASRTSVGRKWGHGPTQVNGIPLKLGMKVASPNAKLFVLDGAGKRMAQVPLASGKPTVVEASLGPAWKTLWYELVAE